MSLFDKVLQGREEQDRVCFIALSPASVCAGVAYRAYRHSLYQQSVVVAVCAQAYKVEVIARRLTFSPQALAASAVERHAFRLNRLGVCLTVHVAKHQYVLGVGILDYGRNKPA